MLKGNLQFIRSDKSKGNFTQINNSIITHPDLNSSEKIFLIYLLSQNENWTYNREKAGKDLGIKPDSLKRIYNSLKKKGFVNDERDYKNAPDGKQYKTIYTVIENPKQGVILQQCKNATVQKCNSANLLHINNTNINNNTNLSNTNTKKINKKNKPSRDLIEVQNNIIENLPENKEQKKESIFDRFSSEFNIPVFRQLNQWVNSLGYNFEELEKILDNWTDALKNTIVNDAIDEYIQKNNGNKNSYIRNMLYKSIREKEGELPLFMRDIIANNNQKERMEDKETYRKELLTILSELGLNIKFYDQSTDLEQKLAEQLIKLYSNNTHKLILQAINSGKGKIIHRALKTLLNRTYIKLSNYGQQIEKDLKPIFPMILEKI